MSRFKRPSFQFYPADHRKDEGLQACSLGARGLWVDMLCVMHECVPYGHLVVSGRGLTDSDVESLLRPSKLSAFKFRNYFAELESNGVFSRTKEGTIFSRRMVKDEATRNARSAAGSLGGNPLLLKPEVKPEVKQNAKSGPVRLTPKVNLAAKTCPPPSSSSSSSENHTMGNVDSPEAVEIIRTFDLELVAAFGPERARPWPHGTDHTMALRWVMAGATVDLVRPIFARGQASRVAANDPVLVLSYFNKPVERALAVANAPGPGAPVRGAHAPTTMPLPRLSKRDRDRGWIETYLRAGIWPAPQGPGCWEANNLLEPDLVAEYAPSIATKRAEILKARGAA